MARPSQALFLEDWLTASTSPSAPSPPPRPALPPAPQSIIQAWSDLRDALRSPSFAPHHLQSLHTLALSSSRSSLHVADPQAKLLLSLLPRCPPRASPLVFRLLYVWARKSSNPSLTLVDSLVAVLSAVFSNSGGAGDVDQKFVGHGVLLLGAVSVVSGLSDSSKRSCLELLCRLLEEEVRLVDSIEEHIAAVLAGIGYALVCSEKAYFVRILGSLLGGVWKSIGSLVSVSHGLMLLHLMEWVVSNSVDSRTLDNIEIVCVEVSEFRERNYSKQAVIMASSGILRCLNRVQLDKPGTTSLKILTEGSIGSIALDLMSKTENFCNLSGDEYNSRLSLQFISLGLARCGPCSFHSPLLICLAMSLITEIFPLPSFYTRAIGQHGVLASLDLDEVRKHSGSALFREAGAITNAFCNQYVLADEENKLLVENHIWKYCEESYWNHRLANLVLRNEGPKLLLDLEKIAEAAFLMLVIFASVVVKQKMNLKLKCSPEVQSEVSVRTLAAFSCLEYFRRVRLPEYSDTIRTVVKSIQNESASISFVESMPSYFKLTNQQVEGLGKRTCNWSEDEVQTARILFYLRVIPTCVEHIPHQVFSKSVVPTMFLYMRHPTGKVACASHTVFASFLSSGKESDQDERVLLKEQLIFFYIERSLKVYPGITPYEGLVSGIGALVRHAPAGSPAILYCIHSLVQKATSLCDKAMKQNAEMWKNWHGDSEPSKKSVELLLRLISLVDIQVLPDLLKLLAQLIIKLPKEGQIVVLNQIYSQVAESDDVTRKPSLVSWLHSVTYLCSTSSSKAVQDGNNAQNTSDVLSLNRTRSRL